MTLALTFIATWPSALRKAGEQVLGALQNELGEQLPAGTINLKLVDGAAQAALNKQYNGNAYATDVLTFNYGENDNVQEGELADVTINLDAATRQARDASTALADEVALLITHGILHVLGYDHHEAADRAALDDLQNRIVTLAGYAYRDFRWQT